MIEQNCVCTVCVLCVYDVALDRANSSLPQTPLQSVDIKGATGKSMQQSCLSFNAQCNAFKLDD